HLFHSDSGASKTVGNALGLSAKSESLISSTIHQQEADNDPVRPMSRTENKTTVRVGDRLSLSFFERLGFDDEEKWAARFQGRRPAINFHQRTELTGVYEVQENGLIVLPLLG